MGPIVFSEGSGK